MAQFRSCLPLFRLNSILVLLVFITNINAQSSSDDLIAFCSSKKGFNLLGKFDAGWSNSGYTSKEFSVIRDLGFNFARLPVDYRTYTQPGNWDVFLENELQEIDQAVEWGIQYGVHVCINLHRAPGYCVNYSELPVNQKLNLWTDPVAQSAFARHWKFFANRYKDIGPEYLSFNLVNEPSGVSSSEYLFVMKMALDSIRSVSPNRIVFIDGLDYGRHLIPELKDEPFVAQSIHCYDPFGLTHYKAEWVDGSSLWPVPLWPMLWVSNYLYGPWKSDLKSPLIIEGNFPQGTEVIVNVRQVSIESTLQIKNEKTVLFSKRFVCSADPGSDFTQVVQTQWGYQNISNKDFSFTLTSGEGKLIFENSSGDWMTINSISFISDGVKHTYALSDDTWGNKQSAYKLENWVMKSSDGSDLLPFGTYAENVRIAKENNIAFMVQEFGVYNRTPHEVTIGFLKDLMRFLSTNEVGYALWNLNGSFGILNSGRSDCKYESWQGYQLDREMLNVLTAEYFPLSIERNKTGSLKIFPVPAKDFLHVSSDNQNFIECIELIDLNGRVLRKYLAGKNENGQISLSLSGITDGIYILNIRTGKMSYTSRFVVQKSN